MSLSLLTAPTKPQVIEEMMQSNSAQSSAGLLLQSYCNTVLSQPKVNFAGFESLAPLQTEVNAGLATAQGRASHYLDDIQPLIIRNITNMSSYFDLHSAVATSLPPNATKKEWLDALAAVKEAADGYQGDATNVVGQLRDLHKGLTSDVASFTSVVTRLNAAVDGDNGVLAGIEKQLNEIDGKMAGAITGIVLSGLATVGGAIMILVGALAEAVTGGAATALVVGGVAVLAAGVGGAIGSGLVLGGMLNAKAELITNRSKLQADVRMAQGMSSGFKALGEHAGTAVEAASSMRNAWQFLGDDLSSLSSNLDKGIVSTDVLRQIWLTTANTSITRVRGDIDTIKAQMTGTQLSQAPKGVTISQFVKETAQKLDSAA